MSIEEFPLIDITKLDMLVSNYGLCQQMLSPEMLFADTDSGCTVEDELFNQIRLTVQRDLCGQALVASSLFAIGFDEIDQVTPTMIATGHECTFAGRATDAAILDFTDAAVAAGMIETDKDRILMPGILFCTDASLEDKVDNLGVLSLAPYCAILPGSLYELRRIRFRE